MQAEVTAFKRFLNLDSELKADDFKKMTFMGNVINLDLGSENDDNLKKFLNTVITRDDNSKETELERLCPKNILRFIKDLSFQEDQLENTK